MKETLIDEYKRVYLESIEKFGKKTTVAIQVGSFYEVYGMDTETECWGNPEEIGEICNLVFTRKNKKKPHSKSNPYLVGVPCGSWESRYLPILVRDYSFTIVVMDQEEQRSGTKRSVAKVISPGTFADSEDNNFITCIYFEKTKSYRKLNNSITSTKPNKCNSYNSKGTHKRMAGISSIDTSTGESYIYEIYESDYDLNYFTDELFRYLQSVKSIETVIYSNGCSSSNSNSSSCSDKMNSSVLKDLEIPENYSVKVKNLEKEKMYIDYQNKLLGKIFKKETQLSKLEELDLEKFPLASIAYTQLLEFVMEHQKNLVSQLIQPEYYTREEKCILEKNAMYQLNIIPTREQEKNYKSLSSVFNVLNKTNTCMGKRLLYKRLLNPICNIDKLNESYNKIQFYVDLMNTEPETFKIINRYFKEILDLEKMARNMFLLSLDLASFSNFIDNLKTGIKAVKCINKEYKKYCKKETETQSKEFTLKETQSIKEIVKFIEEVEKSVNITKGVIKESTNEKLDGCNKEIKECENKLEEIRQELLVLLKSKDKKVNDTSIKLEKLDKGLHYYTLTKIRHSKIKSQLKNYKSTVQTNNVRLTSSVSDSYSSRLINLKESKSLLENEILCELMETFTNNYSVSIRNFIRGIALNDFYISGAKTASINKYYKPILVSQSTVLENNAEREENNNVKREAKNGVESGVEREAENGVESGSEITVKELRHPLVEKLLTETEYIANDINLNKKESGILLFGLNASGKTTIQKSVGVAVIMAQSGLFVPAKEMKLVPFKKILTRITGSDDIHKGQSTFVMEMTELNGILRRADKNTLVIGDEICHGTEAHSGSGIVGASLIRLSELGAKFIFATHLHNLSESNYIKNVETLKMKHLSVEYKDDYFIYTRKIKEGSGPSTYGIEVAKALGLPENVMEMAEKIRETESGISKGLTTKVSNYNRKKIMDSCEICGTEMGNAKVSHKEGKIVPLNTHHIKFQKDSVDNFNGFTHKNHPSNLMTVCNNCHDLIHEGKININNRILTNKGYKFE